MTLIYRLKRLVKSDMHALIENIEEPKYILAQSLRDMREELDHLEARLKTITEKTQDYKQTLENSEKTLSDLEEKISLALSEKKEDTGRFFIKKQILEKKNQKELCQKIEKTQAILTNLKKDYDNKNKAYEEISEQSKTLLQKFENQSDAFDYAKKFELNETELEHEVELEFLKRVKGGEAS